MSPALSPEDVLVQALHQHSVRAPMPPMDPLGLDARLARADRLAVVRTAGIAGGVVMAIAIIAVLLLLGAANRDADVNSANTTTAAGAGPVTTPKHGTTIVIGANGEPIVLEDVGGDPSSSTTVVDDSSTTAVTEPGASSTTGVGPTTSGNPGNPGVPGDPNTTAGPTVPGVTTAPTTAASIPSTTASSTPPTTAATTTTTAAPPCTATITPASGTGRTATVTVYGHNPRPGAAVTVSSAYGSASSVSNADGNYYVTITLTGVPLGNTTLAVECHATSSTGSRVIGRTTVTYTRLG